MRGLRPFFSPDAGKGRDPLQSPDFCACPISKDIKKHHHIRNECFCAWRRVCPNCHVALQPDSDGCRGHGEFQDAGEIMMGAKLIRSRSKGSHPFFLRRGLGRDVKQVLLFVMIAWTSSVSAEVFKCLDASGKTSYQEVPCAPGAKAAKSNLAGRAKAKSDLPCDPANVNQADRKLAVYLLRTAAGSYYAIRSGGSPEHEVSQFRRASVDAGNIPVPECMERARETMQKYLEFAADQVSAAVNGRDFSSGNSRSANLRAEYHAVLDAARRQAREPTHVWATTGK